jgi:copper(I)-binding protein
VSRLSVTALVLSAAAVSACGTGLEAQTYKATGRQDGTNAVAQSLAVRNLHVVGPAFGSTHKDQAVVTGFIANPSDTPDAVVSASTDVATGVELREADKPVPSIPVPARGASTSTWSILLTGLTRQLHAGEYVSLTLTFEKAERITVQVPVRAGDNGLETRPEARNPYHHDGGE